MTSRAPVDGDAVRAAEDPARASLSAAAHGRQRFDRSADGLLEPDRRCRAPHSSTNRRAVASARRRRGRLAMPVRRSSTLCGCPSSASVRCPWHTHRRVRPWTVSAEREAGVLSVTPDDRRAAVADGGLAAVTAGTEEPARYDRCCVQDVCPVRPPEPQSRRPPRSPIASRATRSRRPSAVDRRCTMPSHLALALAWRSSERIARPPGAATTVAISPTSSCADLAGLRRPDRGLPARRWRGASPSSRTSTVDGVSAFFVSAASAPSSTKSLGRPRLLGLSTRSCRRRRLRRPLELPVAAPGAVVGVVEALALEVDGRRGGNALRPARRSLQLERRGSSVIFCMTSNVVPVSQRYS